MRVALLGWDLDHEAAAELGALGVEVVGFTRWFPDQPAREAHHGWLEVRCPHEIGGGSRDEALAFAVAAVREASTSGLGFDFDVVHALDFRTRSAAGELADRAPGSVLAASSEEDDAAEHAEFGPRESPDGWICDHPWSADRLRARIGMRPPVFTVPTESALSIPRPAPSEAVGSERGDGPCVVLSFGSDAWVSTRTLVRALKIARERVPGLVVALFDVQGRYPKLRRALGRTGLLDTQWPETGPPTAGLWNAAAAQAAVLGVSARDLVDDPTAQAAWLAGVPVVGLHTNDAEALGLALADAVFCPERRDHDVRARAALADRRLGSGPVAAGWLRAYLLLLDRRRVAPTPEPDSEKAELETDAPHTLAFPELRSRLTLTPVSSREVLASWSLRPDDWRSALEWMGPEAVRAVLTIRLFDVTDVAYDGLNAHGVSDIDLSLSESHRVITAPYEGRSLAACLGARTQWGYFHPLAHARICHLPREGLAPASDGKRLRIMPRRTWT